MYPSYPDDAGDWIPRWFDDDALYMPEREPDPGFEPDDEPEDGCEASPAHAGGAFGDADDVPVPDALSRLLALPSASPESRAASTPGRVAPAR